MLTKTSKLLSVITAVVIVMSSALTAIAAPQLIEGDGKGSLIIEVEVNPSKADGDKSIAIGNNVNVSSDYGIGMGSNISLPEKANSAIAIGNFINNYTNPDGIFGQYGVMIGSHLEANDYGVVLGFKGKASGYNSIALGQSAAAMEESAIAAGYGAGVYSTNGISLGKSSRVGWESQNAVAIGANAKVGNNAQNAIALGTGSYTEESNTLSLGMIADMGDGSFYHLKRRITNMSAGINDTDAVNVSQLKNITGVDWKFDADGNVTDGGFTIKGSTDTFKTIQDAFDYLSDGWKFEATNDAASSGGNAGASAGSSNIGAGDTLTLNGGKNIEISSDGNDKYTINMKDDIDVNSVSVGGKVNTSSSGINMGGADIATGGGNIDMGGDRITNVAGGAIAQGSTDAVNGGQLWDAYQRMDAMGGDIYRRMDDLREDVNIVGAHAAALSGLHPIDYNPYEPTTLSAAVGTYRDEYAVAVGVFHYTRENVMFNLGASLCSDGDIMGRAGVSFTVGKSSDKPKVAGTMNGLRNQVIAMQAKLDELEAEKKKDKELLRRNEEIMKQNAELIRELTKKLEAKR